MKTVVMCIVGLAALAGCATQRETVVYDKPGVTASEIARDQALCAGVASARESRPKLLATVTPDRDEYVRCMESLGYSTGRVSLSR
jgi:uncharacterized lipoprotein YajG